MKAKVFILIILIGMSCTDNKYELETSSTDREFHFDTDSIGKILLKQYEWDGTTSFTEIIYDLAVEIDKLKQRQDSIKKYETMTNKSYDITVQCICGQWINTMGTADKGDTITIYCQKCGKNYKYIP